MSKLFLYCDGAIEPRNPGGHAVGGWVLKDENDSLICVGNIDCGESPEMTNNIAEYAAVLSGLRDGIEGLEDYEIIVRTDSKLVVEQLNKRWKCHSEHLRPYRDKILNLMKSIGNVSIEWIPREENTEADTQSRALYGLQTVNGEKP